MKRCRTAWPALILVLPLAACLAVVLFARPEPVAAEAPAAAPDVERLIEDLGSKDFDAREAATRALTELDDAPPALRRALGAADLEVRRRVAEILEGIEQRRAQRGLARAEALAKEGRIVEAVDRIVAFAERDKGAAGGQILTRFAARLLEATPKADLRRMQMLASVLRSDIRQQFPAGDFRTYVDASSPRELIGAKLSILRPRGPRAESGVVFARGDEVFWEDFPTTSSLVAASGDVRALGPQLSVIVAGGNLTGGRAIGTFIVCDGDVEFSEYATQSLVLARGKVTSARPMFDCVIRSAGAILDRDGKKVALKEGTTDPFAFVKFFELSDVGLAVAERDGGGEAVRDGVFLKEVRKGTLFAPGLQAGDIVTAIDGTKAASQEVFRRLLRKRLAQGGPHVTFTVRRGGQTAEVAVPVKD